MRKSTNFKDSFLVPVGKARRRRRCADELCYSGAPGGGGKVLRQVENSTSNGEVLLPESLFHVQFYIGSLCH